MSTYPLRRLAIAAGDPRQALTFQAHLQNSLQVHAPVVRFEETSQLLTPETDGDILLFALDPADAAPVETIVREAKVQQIPARFALVESDQARGLRLLDPMASHFTRRWLWPSQTRDLTSWVQQRLQHGTPFVDPATETTAERFRHRLINQTPSLTAMVEQLCIAANHDVTVLIEGEPGTGKTFLAKLIHESSARAPHRFAAVACGALSGNLLASELFGHTPGAFPGADVAKVGKLAAVGEGTILLEEIDTLSLEHQTNLLRVLESGEIEPLGGSATQVCRARIIAATNWNLADAVERGLFRRDLYYRLHVISLQLPPLRHRPEDIGPLVRGMVARYGTRFGKKLFGISAEALRALEAYPWPGNIRQLENAIQQAVLTSHGNELKLNHLSASIASRGDSSAPALAAPTGFGGTLKQSRESSERANILRALEKAGDSRSRAAQLLGVSRVTLYKKMKKYGLFSARGVQAPFARDDDPTRVAGG